MALYTTGFPADLVITVRRDSTSDRVTQDRLRGSINGGNSLYLNTPSAQTTAATYTNFAYSTGVDLNSSISGYYISYVFRRAPGFFDVVCYTGNGGSTNIVNHNLTVAPELTIVKNRSSGGGGDAWGVRYLSSTITVFNGWTSGLNLNTAASGTGLANGVGWSINSTSFDASGGGYGYPNLSGQNYVAYLFATCPGVSKVGNYTGTGTTKQIDCGFTGGARFVLIKRTDSTVS